MARSRQTSAQRRHARNNSRMAIERAKIHVYTQCDICGSEFVVNNNHEQKARTKHLKLGPFIVCPTCRCILPGGKVVSKGSIDWARRYVQMYIVVKKTSEQANNCGAEDNEGCKCTGHIAQRLLKEMDDERPRRRLYRKNRKGAAPPEV